MKNFNKISKEKWIQLKRNADMYEVEVINLVKMLLMMK